MSSPKVILLACGSFNPPTFLHFRMFEIARDYFNQMGTHQIIGGIISPVHNSYGKKSLLDSKYRCSMVKIGLKSSDWIRLSDWESQQEQWTRTRLTLQYHQNYINSFVNDIKGSNEILPGWLPDGIKSGTGTVQLKLLCGADLLESFSTPGLWETEDIEAIVGQHGIVVISRNGSNPEQFIFNSDILTKYRRNIFIVTNWVPNEISSTMVRRLINRGQSVKYLIDDNIIDYIKKHGLFGINDSKYILTPNQNQMLFLEQPQSTKINNDNFIRNQLNNYHHQQQQNNYNNQYINDDEDDMDETDYINNEDKQLLRNKVFCCTDNVKTLLNRPGQAVQIVTDTFNGLTSSSKSKSSSSPSSTTAKYGGGGITTISRQNIITDEVGDHSSTICNNYYNIDTNLIDDLTKNNFNKQQTQHIKNLIRPSITDEILTMPTTSERNNDIIKFVFTDHGIRVISDKEYVV